MDRKSSIPRRREKMSTRPRSSRITEALSQKKKRVLGGSSAGGGRGSTSTGMSSGRQVLEQLQSSEHGTSSPSLPPWHPNWKGPYRIAAPPHVLPPTSLESSETDSDSESERSDRSGSGYSSPLYEPVIPKVPVWKTPDGRILYGFTDDEAELDMYYADLAKFQKKKARQELLPTLSRSLKLPVNYNSKQKEIILHAAKSIIRLSAHHDGKVIGEYTGAVIKWDKSDTSTTILTSSWIFCTQRPFDDWSEKDYAPKAKVVAHLLDGSTHDVQLLYYSQHYDLALFEIRGESLVQNLPISWDTSRSEDIIVLARDMNFDLICKKVNVLSLNPCEHQHNHYQFIDGSIPKCGTGGVLLGAKGKIKGMLFYALPNTAFVSSSIILSCLSQWKNIRLLVRPHLGLKLNSVCFLDISHIERLSRILDTTTGLIVNEVSSNCAAEKNGVRVGDIILSCQGENVSSIAQLETILLGISEKHLEKSIDLYSKIPVKVEVLHVRNGKRRIVTLKLKLSEGIEVFRSVKPILRQDPDRTTVGTHDLVDKLLHVNLDKGSGEESEKQTRESTMASQKAALDAEEQTSENRVTMETPNLAVKLRHGKKTIDYAEAASEAASDPDEQTSQKAGVAAVGGKKNRKRANKTMKKTYKITSL